MTAFILFLILGLYVGASIGHGIMYWWITRWEVKDKSGKYPIIAYFKIFVVMFAWPIIYLNANMGIIMAKWITKDFK